MTTPSGPRAAVLRPSDLPTHDRGGGASTTPLVGPSVGAAAFINGITSFAPGTAIPFHSHNCEESVMLLQGHAIMDCEGKEYELKPFDTTWIPPNVSHRFRNVSDTEPCALAGAVAKARPSDRARLRTRRFSIGESPGSGAFTKRTPIAG